MGKQAAAKKPVAAEAPVSQAGPPPVPLGETAPGIEAAEVAAAIVLGRGQICLEEALALGTHSIVDLDRGINDPVDVVIGGRVVARGEVVTVDEHFGVRITEVLE